MEARQAFAVILISIGLFVAVAIFAAGALRDSSTLAWALAGPVIWLLVELGSWLWLDSDDADDRKPAARNRGRSDA